MRDLIHITKKRKRIIDKITKPSNCASIYTASLSVEAAICMPIFIFACIVMLDLISMLGFTIRVQNALYNTAEGISKHYYIYEKYKQSGGVNIEEISDENTFNELLSNGIEVAAIHSIFALEMKDSAAKDYVKNGLLGMKFYTSDVINSDGTIDIVVNYELVSKIDVFNLTSIKVTQRAKTRCFKGDETIVNSDEQNKKEYVYITANGEVFHCNENCPYIKIVTREVSVKDIENIRNKSSGKYYPCSFCDAANCGDTCYITEYGDRYHKDKNCPKIRRGVLRVLRSEVTDRRPCSKCGGSSQ